MSRLAVRAVLASLLILTSGCAGFALTSDSTDEDSGAFRGVRLANEDSTAHTVDVVVLHDGSVVHWTTRHLASSDEGVDSEALVAPPDIANTTRAYTVLIRIDNSTDALQYTTGDDSDCYGSSVEILDDGQLRRAVTYFDASKCGSATTAADTGA